MDKICFVINSQKKGVGHLKDEIQKVFSKTFEVGFLLTTGYRSAEQQARMAVEMGYTFVVAVGGDGTVNEVINGVMLANPDLRERVVVAVLTNGTGNDFARSIGASCCLEDLYKQLLAKQYSLIDVIKVSYKDSAGATQIRYFNNIADIGIGPDTLITVGAISRFVGGTIAFSIAALKALFFLKPRSIYLETPKENFACRVKCVCLANGTYFGSGMGIAPNAKLNDGLLNLVVIEDVTALDFIKLAGELRAARIIKHPKVKYISTKRVAIEAQDKILPLEMDGEMVGFAPIVAEVIPSAIQVVGSCFCEDRSQTETELQPTATKDA